MIQLRSYQLETIEAIRSEIAHGHRSVCVVIPTGGGKTATASEIIRRSVAKGKRCLFVAHRAELIDQAVEALSKAGVNAGAQCASAESAPQPFAPVQVATLQTLIARKIVPPADLIVFDEAHHAPAATFAKFMAQYPPTTVVLGLTATPERSDGKGLGSMFDALVVGARVKQLIELGHLVPSHIIRPASKLKEFQIAQRPVDAYLQHAKGRRAIVFCARVALAEECRDDFRAAGFRSEFVEGNTAWAERRAAFSALKAGTLDALANVYVATEGFDVPEIDCVILARGIGTAGGYLQMVGRGLRPAPWSGKSDLIVIDLTGVSHDHGHAEDDRIYTLDGKGISSPKESVPGIFCAVCGCIVESYPSTLTPCPECGHAPPPPEMKVTGDPLVKYASKRAEPQEKRVETFARWIRESRAKGWKQKAPHGKYRAVYGEWPPAAIEAAAMEMAK